MSLAIMSIPDDPERLPKWLEEQLVGNDLHRLVEELAAIHRPGSKSGSIETLLGSRRAAVLASGLAAVPPATLQHLLRQPQYLMDLQETVLSHGGPYWDGVPRSAELDRSVRGGWERLQAQLPQATVPYAKPDRQKAVRWLPVAFAAGVVIATVGTMQFIKPTVIEQRTPQGWGWAKADGLPTAATPDAYLEAVASQADEWFQERPNDAASLARRLGEFRQGCSVLILAEHRTLSPEQRTWLQERCAKWAVKFDQHIAAIEAGGDPVMVRAEADATVRQLTTAIRGEASKAAV